MKLKICPQVIFLLLSVIIASKIIVLWLLLKLYVFNMMTYNVFYFPVHFWCIASLVVCPEFSKLGTASPWLALIWLDFSVFRWCESNMHLVETAFWNLNFELNSWDSNMQYSTASLSRQQQQALASSQPCDH